MLRRTSHHSTCQGRGRSPIQAGQFAVQLVVGGRLAAPAVKVSLETPPKTALFRATTIYPERNTLLIVAKP